jgi:hypothetical protein
VSNFLAVEVTELKPFTLTPTDLVILSKGNVLRGTAVRGLLVWLLPWTGILMISQRPELFIPAAISIFAIPLACWLVYLNLQKSARNPLNRNAYSLRNMSFDEEAFTLRTGIGLETHYPFLALVMAKVLPGYLVLHQSAIVAYIIADAAFKSHADRERLVTILSNQGLIR